MREFLRKEHDHIRSQHLTDLFQQKRNHYQERVNYKHPSAAECLASFQTYRAKFEEIAAGCIADFDEQIRVWKLTTGKTATPEEQKVSTKLIVDAEAEKEQRVLTRFLHHSDTARHMQKVRWALASHPENVHAGPLVESGLLPVVKLVLHHFRLAPHALLVETTWVAANFSIASRLSALLVHHDSAVHSTTWVAGLSHLEAGVPTGPLLMRFVADFLDHAKEQKEHPVESWRVFEIVLWCVANSAGHNAQPRRTLAAGLWEQVRLHYHAVLPRLETDELRSVLTVPYSWILSNMLRSVDRDGIPADSLVQVLQELLAANQAAGVRCKSVLSETLHGVSSALKCDFHAASVRERGESPFIHLLLSTGALQGFLDELDRHNLASSIAQPLVSVLNQLARDLAAYRTTAARFVQEGRGHLVPTENPDSPALCFFTGPVLAGIARCGLKSEGRLTAAQKRELYVASLDLFTYLLIADRDGTLATVDHQQIDLFKLVARHLNMAEGNHHFHAVYSAVGLAWHCFSPTAAADQTSCAVREVLGDPSAEPLYNLLDFVEYKEFEHMQRGDLHDIAGLLLHFIEHCNAQRGLHPSNVLLRGLLALHSLLQLGFEWMETQDTGYNPVAERCTNFGPTAQIIGDLFAKTDDPDCSVDASVSDVAYQIYDEYLRGYFENDLMEEGQDEDTDPSEQREVPEEPEEPERPQRVISSWKAMAQSEPRRSDGHSANDHRKAIDEEH